VSSAVCNASGYCTDGNSITMARSAVARVSE
jgi:hypothetical protein